MHKYLSSLNSCSGEHLLPRGEYDGAEDCTAGAEDGQCRAEAAQEQPPTGASVLWVSTLISLRLTLTGVHG